MSQQVENNVPTRPTRPKRRAWKLARRIFLGLIFFFVILVLLLQLPVVQNWLAKQVTASLEQTLETRVSVDNVHISWLDEMTIEGLFIEDKYGDTLLYGKTLRANFALFGGLVIESVLIADTKFNIRRDLGDPESNLQTALQKLFPPTQEKSNPLNLKLNRLDLQRISFVQNDSVRGQRFDVSLQSGVARISDLDLPNKIIRITSMELRSPHVRQTSTPPTPIFDLRDSLLRQLDETIVDTNATYLHIIANSIEIIDGVFDLDNFRKDPIVESDISAVDFARLGTRNIDLELTEVDFYKAVFTGKLKHLSLEEKSGFILDRLSVQDLKITPTLLQLYDLKLETAESSLSDSLRFRFREGWNSWSEFNDKVILDIQVKDSEVAVRDIMYFARNLRFNQFFRDNRRQKINIGGHFSSRVNNLRGKDINLALDNYTRLEGSFSSRNLTIKGSEALNLQLRRLTTNMNTLRRLIPAFTPPENFDRLGRLNFNGSFDGFFTDFVFNGNLKTDIGQTTVDMKLETATKYTPANYRGALSLDDFNLGTWLDNPQFGTVSLNGTINNGIGLEANTAKADLEATIRDFTFRDYTYQNAVIDGRLEDRFFNGRFTIADDNIDFSFLGELDFRDSIPTFDFDASVGELDLYRLNLSKKPIALSGNIDLNLTGTDFSEMEGRVALDSFEVKVDTVVIAIDSLLAYSNFNQAGQKVVKLESDIAQAELIGRFDLDEVTSSLIGFLVEYYPKWASRLNITPPRRLPAPNRFSFDLNILDSRGLNRLITPKLGALVDVNLRGSYDGFVDSIDLEFTAPNLYFEDFQFTDCILKASSDRGEGGLDFAVGSTISDKRPILNKVTLLSLIDNDL
ncbi:MAG: hypothetical protein ACI81P_001179, partial [Neolewinella sp.]